MPPNRSDQVGKVVFQLIAVDGNEIATFAAEDEQVFQEQGHFARRTARWPTTVAAPGTYHVHAIVYDPAGMELTRVAPRMVSVNLEPGY
jgi:hypothetical protein